MSESLSMRRHGIGIRIISESKNVLSWIPGGRQKQAVSLSRHSLVSLRRNPVLQHCRFRAFNRCSWMKMEKKFSETMSQETCVFVFHGLELFVPPTEIMSDVKTPISRCIQDSTLQEMVQDETRMGIIRSQEE